MTQHKTSEFRQVWRLPQRHGGPPGQRGTDRLVWVSYAARRSCPTPLYRLLRSACSAIWAQCWAKLSRESKVSGCEVTSAILRQSQAASLYSSAVSMGIAKPFLREPRFMPTQRTLGFRCSWSRPKISKGMSFGTGALPKFMSGRRDEGTLHMQFPAQAGTYPLPKTLSHDPAKGQGCGPN